MIKFKHMAAIASISVLALVAGCSSQIDDDAKKVAKFKCQYDALTAKMLQEPANAAAYQTDLAKLAAEEDAMTQLNKKYRDNSSPTDQEKFKKALLKAISEGCTK